MEHVGLYLNAPYPIMLSDCFARSRSSGSPQYTPSNIEFYEYCPGALSELVSKFVSVDKDTIVAFSGRDDSIRTFAKHLPEGWRKRNQELRPMEWLKEQDYAARSIYNSWDCSVLGASVVGNTENPLELRVNNYASRNVNWKFHTENFGECFAIGSGAVELRGFIENADRNIGASGSLGDHFLERLIGALNGKALFCQQKEPLLQTWGGLLQSQIYSSTDNKWDRTPPWYHMAVVFDRKPISLKGAYPTAVLHTTQVNDPNGSAILTTVRARDGVYSTVSWPVQSPFANSSSKRQVSYSDILQVPEFTTITSFIGTDHQSKVNHNTYPTGQVKGLSFAQNGDSFESKVDLKDLGEWMRMELLKVPSIAQFTT